MFVEENLLTVEMVHGLAKGHLQRCWMAMRWRGHLRHRCRMTSRIRLPRRMPHSFERATGRKIKYYFTTPRNQSLTESHKSRTCHAKRRDRP